MTAATLALAGAQLLALGAAGHAVVALVYPDRPRWLGAPERWLLAVLGAVVWSVVLMLAHLATWGRVFSSPFVVPTVTAGLLLTTALRSRPRPRKPPQEGSDPQDPPLPRTATRVGSRPQARKWMALVAGGAILFALYALPAIRGGSSLRTGDPPWHLGWTEQLLGGDPLPTGPAPVYARNAYPWGFHATLATMTRLVPGSDPMVAHEALHLTFIAAIPLGAACLARLVNRRAGPAAAAVCALIGGFGWIASGGPDFVASPSEARYGADLVVASPNSLFELLPPALPRELGLILLAAAAVLIAVATRGHALRPPIVAGIAVGAVGLVSVPMFVSAIVWSLLLLWGTRQEWSRGRVLLFGGTAASMFALWAGPVLVDFGRYGGFLDVSERLGVEWPVPTSLAAWGLLLPLALAGAGVALSQPPALRRPLVMYGCGCVGLLALSWARGRFGWEVLANQTLLHQGRFWPPAHLLGAALGGIALVTLYGWLRSRGRVLAVGGVAAIFAIGAISPLYASIDLTRTIRGGESGFLYGTDDLQRGSFLRQAAAELDPDDITLVVEGDLLAFYLWQFSGTRLADDNAGPLEPNPWRIRFKELAARWYERESEGNFNTDWVFSKRARYATEDARAFGTYRDTRWFYFSTNESFSE